MRMENEVETAMRKEIDELSTMPVGQLRQKYLEVFGEESRSSNRQFLFRRIASILRGTGHDSQSTEQDSSAKRRLPIDRGTYQHAS